MNNPFHSLRKVLIVFALILLGGTLGYRYIENLPWLDAVYMVIQTVSTVGFNEVKPLSTEGVPFFLTNTHP